jgi:hypothetical protein
MAFMDRKAEIPVVLEEAIAKLSIYCIPQFRLIVTAYSDSVRPLDRNEDQGV